MNSVLKLKELQMDDATGKLPGKAAELLKYSGEARTQFGEDSRYKDLMFAVGLIFDFIFYLQKTPFLNLGGAKFDETINQAFARAVEQGAGAPEGIPLQVQTLARAPFASHRLRPSAEPGFDLPASTQRRSGVLQETLHLEAHRAGACGTRTQ
jgi:hypothetical protein